MKQLISLLILTGSLRAQIPPPPEPPPPPPPILIANLGTACQVYQNHTSSGASLDVRFANAGSRWTFRVENAGLKGPWLRGVAYKGGDLVGTQLVFEEAGLAEVFVTYHGGKDLFDMQWTSPQHVREITVGDLPPAGGGLVVMNVQQGSMVTAEPIARVAVECRERGIDWLCKQPGVNKIQRGYEVIVWAVSDAGNYDNILQYVFRDDGSLGFRLGTSGYLNQDVSLQPGEAHMHNALWRVVTRPAVKVYRTVHTETGSTANDAENPISNETSFAWDPLEFTSVLVEYSGLNPRGHKRAHEFVPFGVTGLARHDDTWTGHDFWITRNKSLENGKQTTAPNDWRLAFRTPDQYMMAYANGEALGSGSRVIWYRSSVHHHSTDEDLASDGSIGIVSAHWAGFDYRPHNFFGSNPMTGGAPKCGN